jgi:osmotically inducible protein OsmC
VPGISDHDFHAAAEDAKVNCPVSKALTGVPDVQVEASLAA